MDSLREFFTQFPESQVYWVLYFMLLGCGIGAPLNSDLVLIAASVLASFGYFKLSLIVPVAFLGLLSGDSINFFFARKFGPKILAKAPFRWILTESKVKSAERFILERGEKFIFVVRFLPLVRTALFFTAGSLQVRVRTFYFLNALSTILYLLAITQLAYSAGENIDSWVAGFKQFQFVLLGTVVLVAFTYMIRKKRSMT